MDLDQSATQDEEDEQFIAQPSKSDPNITTSLPTFQSISNATSASGRASKLFEGLNFYLSRETPKGLLEFVIRSFGGRVGWDATVGSGSPYGEDWEGITHVIIDRPLVAGQPPFSSAISTDFSNMSEEEIAKRRRRKYVQPQWVVDSINAEQILSEDRYERGKVLPPHLSPFGEDKGAYQPPMETDQNGDGVVKDVEMQGTGDNDESDE
ncbi:12096_t:CDS:1, partial [Acaulospora colombiana]